MLDSDHSARYSTVYCVGVEARSRSGRRRIVAEAEMTGETKSDGLRVVVVAKCRLDSMDRYGSEYFLQMCIYRELPSR